MDYYNYKWKDKESLFEKNEMLKLLSSLEPSIEIKNTYEFYRLVNVRVQLEPQVKLCSDFLQNAVNFARIMQLTNVAQFC